MNLKGYDNDHILYKKNYIEVNKKNKTLGFLGPVALQTWPNGNSVDRDVKPILSFMRWLSQVTYIESRILTTLTKTLSRFLDKNS